MGGRGGSKLLNVSRRNSAVPGSLPQDIKDLLNSDRLPFKNGGFIERDKISVSDLGLTSSVASTSTNAKKKVYIDISKIDLGRDNLSRKRLLDLEKPLSGGFKRENVTEIEIAPSLSTPGRYTVSSDGNHRVAYGKLSGLRGKIPVTLRYKK